MRFQLGVICGVGIVAALACQAALGATLAHWEADDTPGPGGANSPDVTFAAPNVLASAVTISSGTNTIQNFVSGPVNSSLSGNPVFRTSGWDGPTPTKHYAFEIAVTGANAFGDNTMNIDEVAFYAVHSAGNRSIDFQLDYSLDGIDFLTAGSGQIVDGTGSNWAWDEHTVALGLEGITDPVSFRLYMFGTTESGWTISIDDIRVFGDVVEAPPPVPEPASLAIWSLLGLAAFFIARRQRR